MDPFNYRNDVSLGIDYRDDHFGRRTDNPMPVLQATIPRLRIRGSEPHGRNSVGKRRTRSEALPEMCTCTSPILSFSPVSLEGFDSYSGGPMARGLLNCRVCGKQRARPPVAIHHPHDDYVHEPSYYEASPTQREERRRPNSRHFGDHEDLDIGSAYTVISSSRPGRTRRKYTRRPTSIFSDDASYDTTSDSEQRERIMHEPRHQRTAGPSSPLPRLNPERNRPDPEVLDADPLFSPRPSLFGEVRTHPRGRNQSLYNDESHGGPFNYRSVLKDRDSLFEERPSGIPNYRSNLRDSGAALSEDHPNHSLNKMFSRGVKVDRYLREDQGHRETKGPRERDFLTEDEYQEEDIYSTELEEDWEPPRRGTYHLRATFDNGPRRSSRGLDEMKSNYQGETRDARRRRQPPPMMPTSPGGVLFDASQVQYVNAKQVRRELEEDEPSLRSPSDMRDRNASTRVRRRVVVDGW